MNIVLLLSRITNEIHTRTHTQIYKQLIMNKQYAHVQTAIHVMCHCICTLSYGHHNNEEQILRTWVHRII